VVGVVVFQGGVVVVIMRRRRGWRRTRRGWRRRRRQLLLSRVRIGLGLTSVGDNIPQLVLQLFNSPRLLRKLFLESPDNPFPPFSGLPPFVDGLVADESERRRYDYRQQ